MAKVAPAITLGAALGPFFSVPPNWTNRRPFTSSQRIPLDDGLGVSVVLVWPTLTIAVNKSVIAAKTTYLIVAIILPGFAMHHCGVTRSVCSRGLIRQLNKTQRCIAVNPCACSGTEELVACLIMMPAYAATCQSPKSLSLETRRSRLQKTVAAGRALACRFYLSF